MYDTIVKCTLLHCGGPRSDAAVSGGAEEAATAAMCPRARGCHRNTTWRAVRGPALKETSALGAKRSRRGTAAAARKTSHKKAMATLQSVGLVLQVDHVYTGILPVSWRPRGPARVASPSRSWGVDGLRVTYGRARVARRGASAQVEALARSTASPAAARAIGCH